MWSKGIGDSSPTVQRGWYFLPFKHVTFEEKVPSTRLLKTASSEGGFVCILKYRGSVIDSNKNH